MTRGSNQRFLRALLRSAASDAAPPGAKGRARARLQEHAGSTWITSRGIAGALLIVLIGTTMSSGRIGPSAPAASPTDAPSVAAEAPPLAVTPNGSAAPCGGGVEAPAVSCANAVGGGSGGSLGGM